MSSLTLTVDRGSSELADDLPAIRAELVALRARIDTLEHRLSPSMLRREDRAALERILPVIAGALAPSISWPAKRSHHAAHFGTTKRPALKRAVKNVAFPSGGLGP